MKEIRGDLFDYGPFKENWLVITTNGSIKGNGYAVLGRGVAKQATNYLKWLPKELGYTLRMTGNHVQTFSHNIITFPVKHNWWEKADIELIKQSTYELCCLADDMKLKQVYMPRPGCGNGQLNWAEVRPIIAELDDRFTVVQL